MLKLLTSIIRFLFTCAFIYGLWIFFNADLNPTLWSIEAKIAAIILLIILASD